MVNPAIVLPLYRDFLDAHERVSVERMFEVFGGKYPVIAVVPSKLELAEVRRVLQECGGDLAAFHFAVLPDANLNSIRAYNKTLLSREFYELFAAYSHVLIYQTDAFVFSNRLEEFCRMDVDYWGAPWFSKLHRSGIHDYILPFAGNGGFSLRNVRKFLEVFASPDMHIETAREMWFRLGIQQQGIRLLASRMAMPFSMFARNTLKTSSPPSFLQEDMFWAWYAKRLLPQFRSATAAEALDFAWECLPRRLSEMNDGKIPFGCHAWWKYDAIFWRSHLESLGYPLGKI